MVLPASIRVPITKGICGAEAQPLAPASTNRSRRSGKSAAAMAWSAIVAERALPLSKGVTYG